MKSNRDTLANKINLADIGLFTTRDHATGILHYATSLMHALLDHDYEEAMAYARQDPLLMFHDVKIVNPDSTISITSPLKHVLMTQNTEMQQRLRALAKATGRLPLYTRTAAAMQPEHAKQNLRG